MQGMSGFPFWAEKSDFQIDLFGLCCVSLERDQCVASCWGLTMCSRWQLIKQHRPARVSEACARGDEGPGLLCAVR